MASWLRLWHDMPTDPKWRVIAKRSGQSIGNVIAVFNMMLVCASVSDERGTLQNWSDEDVAAALDIDESDIKSIRDAMQGKVLDGFSLSGWQKRQPDREDYSTPRVKRFREKHLINVTQCNANETQRNNTDTEQNITEHIQNRIEAQNSNSIQFTPEYSFLITLNDLSLSKDLNSKSPPDHINKLINILRVKKGQSSCSLTNIRKAFENLRLDQWAQDTGNDNIYYLMDTAHNGNSAGERIVKYQKKPPNERREFEQKLELVK